MATKFDNVRSPYAEFLGVTDRPAHMKACRGAHSTANLDPHGRVYLVASPWRLVSPSRY